MAQEIDFEDSFNRSVSAQPQFASSLAYNIAGNQTVIMTAGPTTKNGTLAVAQDAPWHIGSISKSFTATLIMRLVERGVLTLDAPIETYLAKYREEMHVDWQTVTLRQLLSHTAGLRANAPVAALRQTQTDDPHQDRYRVLSQMWRAPGKSPSGRFAYSNIGYVLAGFIAEEITGKTWEEMILAEIAGPLGLETLGFGAPQELDAARGHRSLLGFKRAVAPNSPSADNPRWMGPAGTLHLSMADLITWGQVHLRACKGLTPDFLSQTSCQTMQTAGAGDYGLGWVIDVSDSSEPVIWHNGSNTMWYAVLVLLPDENTAIAAVTNVYAPRRIEALVREFRTALQQN